MIATLSPSSSTVMFWIYLICSWIWPFNFSSCIEHEHHFGTCLCYIFYMHSNNLITNFCENLLLKFHNHKDFQLSCSLYIFIKYTQLEHITELVSDCETHTCQCQLYWDHFTLHQVKDLTCKSVVHKQCLLPEKYFSMNFLKSMFYFQRKMYQSWLLCSWIA